MRNKEDSELLEKRRMFLENMGFDVYGGDHDVRIGIEELDFDFSATRLDNESILTEMYRQSFKAGRLRGQFEIKKALQNIITIGDDDDNF